MKISIRKCFDDQKPETAYEHMDVLALMMVEEDKWAREDARRQRGFAWFVRSQVRYIPAWVWLTLAAVVVLVFVASRYSDTASGMPWALGMMASICVLACMPSLCSSRTYRLDELEQSCQNNAANVLMARLLILGCASVFCLTLLIAAACTWTNIGLLSAVLWTCPPFFLCTAGSLVLLRSLRPEDAPPACVALTALFCTALLAMAKMFPLAYGQAALAVWAFAFAVSFIWMVAETIALIRRTAEGFGTLPHRRTSATS
ncbi:hypothetical protein [Slackia heliotrinireducens]|nr:hypothetical protein [Slackia heliotrinireducens]